MTGAWSYMVHGTWGREQDQLRRSLIFLGHPLYYSELNILTYKQEPRRSSTLKQESKEVSTLLESYGPIFFSAVWNTFRCCSFLFKLPAVFGEVTCKPGCPHSLTLKPREHLAFSQQQLSHKLLSGCRADKDTLCSGSMPVTPWEQPNLKPGHARIISELSTAKHRQQPRPAFTTTFSICHPWLHTKKTLPTSKKPRLFLVQGAAVTLPSTQFWWGKEGKGRKGKYFTWLKFHHNFESKTVTRVDKTFWSLSFRKKLHVLPQATCALSPKLKS